MGNYVKAVQILQKHQMEVVLESLGLNLNYLHEEIEEGSQLVVVNCYPTCPETRACIGHATTFRLRLTNELAPGRPGLQLMDHNKNWLSVPVVEAALIVQLRDQIEVMSNGLYKSIVHRVTLTKETKHASFNNESS